MPTQDTRSQIARKVNFAIQLLREAAELMESSPKGDAHAALALPTTLDRARRVALAGAATTKVAALALFNWWSGTPGSNQRIRASPRGFRTLMAAASNVFLRCEA
jgi:hypothetical protein